MPEQFACSKGSSLQAAVANDGRCVVLLAGSITPGITPGGKYAPAIPHCQGTVAAMTHCEAVQHFCAADDVYSWPSGTKCIIFQAASAALPYADAAHLASKMPSLTL